MRERLLPDLMAPHEPATAALRQIIVTRAFVALGEIAPISVCTSEHGNAEKGGQLANLAAS